MARLKALIALLRIGLRELIIFAIMFIVRIMLLLRIDRPTEKCYLFLARIWPRHEAEILSRFGWVYEREGDIDKAIRYFQEASNIEPSNAMYCFDVGTLFEQKGDMPSAIAYYGKALNLGTDFSIEFKSQLRSKIISLEKN